MAKMKRHTRRYVIAGALCLTIALTAFGFALFYMTVLGPIAGTIAPQIYVDNLPAARIPLHGRYVLVDAASARLYMIDDGRVQDSMKVVVGKPESPTPALTDTLHYETLNPYWHVTPDLAQSLIAQRVLTLGPTYLTDKGYEVVTGFTDDAQVLPADTVNWKAVAAGETTVSVRQKPGPANSLGRYKFYLPNGRGIYLHDTPNKGVFAQDKRDLTHGCVRLEDAPRLAKWLLGKDPPLASEPVEHVPLPPPVPITISYLDPMSQMRLASLQ